MTPPLHWTIWIAVCADTDGHDLAMTEWPQGPADCLIAAREYLVEAAPDLVEPGGDEAAWVEEFMAGVAVVAVRLEAQTVQQLAAAIVNQRGAASIADVQEWAEKLPALLEERDAAAGQGHSLVAAGPSDVQGDPNIMGHVFAQVLDRMDRAQVLADTFLSYRNLAGEHLRWNWPVSAGLCGHTMAGAAQQLRELAGEAGGPLLVSLGYGVQLRVVPDLAEDALDALSDGGEDDGDVDTADLAPCGDCAGLRASYGVDPWDGPCPHTKRRGDSDLPDGPPAGTFAAPSREW